MPENHSGHGLAEEVAEGVAGRDVSLARRLGDPRTLGSIAFGVLLLFLLFRVVLNVDFGDVWNRISGADPGFLLLATLAYYATFPLRGYRWRYVLAQVGTRVRFRDATEIVFLSWFVNCLVPAKLGDLYRAYLLKGNVGASFSRTIGTIFVERIADIVVIFCLAVAAGFWSFRGRSRPELDAVFVVGFVFAVALVLGILGLRFLGDRVTRVLPARVGEFYERFRHGTTGALSLSGVPVIGLLTAAIWILEGLRLYFVIRALALPDVGLGISSSLFVALIGSLLTAIPLTPAGVGFVEVGVVGALSIYGVASSAATAVALTDRAISILTVIAIGAVVYGFSRKIRRAHGIGVAAVTERHPEGAS
ncbi:MAG TPA: lysylphosphatidylglycerol synthase transmembrane domain-containing protein, partial [Candidatus Limnocylindria bacterium]|nr:lysylphosphatidylglycerol synthase transmembrane domain-containing protein [Candidatus Limnocylindria bacterium]